MKKRRGTIVLAILIPVFVLGIVSVFSNIVALKDIKNVNSNASEIADKHMISISKLGEIQQVTQNIHTQTLSHIVATDFDTMVSIVEQLRTMEDELNTKLSEYENYLSEENKGNFKALKSSVNNFNHHIANLLAYSAAGNNESAYALANGDIAKCGTQIESQIGKMIESSNAEADNARNALAEVYKTAQSTNTTNITISIIALAAATVIVIFMVIRPLVSAKKQLEAIIKDIDNREGDLTKRIKITSGGEIAALGDGINIFMTKLQNIFQVITGNMVKMDEVVNEVLESVQTSTNSVSSMSALTEELSASMYNMSSNATLINRNTAEVVDEVNAIALRTNEINAYSNEMKIHADHMENAARINMETTREKVNEILDVLKTDIEASKSVNEVDNLTEQILQIAQNTNLLAINASIEAARAGAAGKGFAVVAQEISTLAASSQQSANNIQRFNDIVKSAVLSLTDHTNELLEYMNERILPEFESFVDSGVKYKDKATFIQKSMDEFTEKNDNLQKMMTMIAQSIDSITTAINEGVSGVSGTAESTQMLVADMEKISRKMDDNKHVTDMLKSETDVFTKV